MLFAPSALRLIGFNVGIMALAIVAGWLSAGMYQQPAGSELPLAEPIGAADFGRDVAFILRANFRVIGTVLLGAGTLGLLSLLAVVWNGYGLGLGLALLWDRSPELVFVLMRYLPLEFGAIVLASAGAMALARCVVGVLMLDGAVPSMKGAGRMVLSSLVLMLIAAFLEAGVKQDLLHP